MSKVFRCVGGQQYPSEDPVRIMSLMLDHEPQLPDLKHSIWLLNTKPDTQSIPASTPVCISRRGTSPGLSFHQ